MLLHAFVLTPSKGFPALGSDFDAQSNNCVMRFFLVADSYILFIFSLKKLYKIPFKVMLVILIIILGPRRHSNHLKESLKDKSMLYISTLV